MNEKKLIGRFCGLQAIVVMAVLLAGAQATRAAEGGEGGGGLEAAASTKKTVFPVKEPDYTKGGSLPKRYTNGGNNNYSSLGSMGVIGNIWGDKKDEKGMTDKTRMIQVRSVIKGGPGDGLLNANDVILGIVSPTPDGKIRKDARFDSDVRKALSWAITEAEKNKDGGKLVLTVWCPKGGVVPVTLTIPFKGTYSQTAPWACEKSTKIIAAACQNILQKGFYETKKDGTRVIRRGIPTLLEVLGLLSTGEEKHLPIIKSYARELADALRQEDGEFSTWSISYEMLLLTEYYLVTQDEVVLPAIKHTAVRIAQGASDVGTFSHGSAYRFPAHGKMWKFPSAYGAMNQCSITCALSLVLARKCGVDNEEVDNIVRKAAYFYRWFVDKGSIPYGDHAPYMAHDNNGVNSQAAVLFDLLGDQAAAGYYTRMTQASYKVREPGHTGHFFSFQWGALGAARAGDPAAQSFFRNMQWYTELERQPDGGFVYQPQLANLDHGKYLDWSNTGSRLLHYCLPRKKLYITGKGGSCIAPITGDELKSVVAAGEFDPKGLTTQQLLEALGSWSPMVRLKAAEELGTRDENVVKALITLLDSPNRYAQYGACEGLRLAGRGSEEAGASLLNKLGNSKDMTLRYYAVLSFEKRGEPPLTSSAHAIWERSLASGAAIDKAVPALLKQAAIYEPQMDPLRKLHNVIADILFSKECLLKKGAGIEKVDRRVLIPAVKSLLINPNGNARTRVSGIFPSLTADDLKQLWGDIYYASKYQAPSGSMMAPGVRLQGLKLLSDKGIEEGIPVGIDYILRQEGWGERDRTEKGRPALLKYGKALEPFVPEIDAVLTRWHTGKITEGPQVGSTTSKFTREDAKEFKKRLAEALVKPAPKLESIKPYIDATPDPLDPTKRSK